MPKSVIELSEHANKVVKVVKAKNGFRGKSDTIEWIVEEYEQKILDPALRPEIIEDIERIRGGRFRAIDSLDELLGVEK